MYTSQCEQMDRRTHRYVLLQDRQPLSQANVVFAWQHDSIFRDFFIRMLVDSPFRAFRWETPPLTAGGMDRLFEFVLLDSPELVRSPDREVFSSYYSRAKADGIAVFENLSGDAILVVPTPESPDCDFCHLASFLRTASKPRQHALWIAVGEAVQDRVSDRPLWLSTAGGGVAWLHVRLDSRPKYFSYRLFAALPPGGSDEKTVR